MYETIKTMYQMLWDCIYAILNIFGYTYNEETGALEKKEEAAE